MVLGLVGLRTQTQNAAFFERKGPERKPWPRGTQEIIAMRFSNASVLPRKSPNRNLCWGFPLGILLTKTRVLERRALERKRKRFRNAAF